MVVVSDAVDRKINLHARKRAVQTAMALDHAAAESSGSCGMF
jgi:hypothetical protein